MQQAEIQVGRGEHIEECEEFEVFDVSPVVSEHLGVFPGDTRFSLKNQLDFGKGHNLRLNTLNTTLHLGAHADAPCHYQEEGVDVSKLSLVPYLGPAQVLTAHVARGVLVGMQHFKANELASIRARRVLVRTNSFPDPNNWNADFCGFEPEFIEFLHSLGVILVGIDTPSVDFEDSKELKSHSVFARTKMSILEGLDLSAVEDGIYELIALPLKLSGADASPVRAVLRRKIQDSVKG